MIEQPKQTEPVTAWATDCRDKYPENHDSGFAGRICMADGNLAWAAVVSDGAGSSMTGLRVSALAVQAFVDAVRNSTLAELSDPAARGAWLREWTGTLHADAVSRFKGGMATFCGAVLLPPLAASDASRRAAEAAQTAAPGGQTRPQAADGRDAAGWKLFTLNVGDSQVRMVTGDGRCSGIVPDAPPNNPNSEGVNPVRVVGVAPKGGFCLMDAEEFPLPAEGPCWILAGSDGFFTAKKGPEELSVFSAADLRTVCLDPAAPFFELPARAIRRSFENARKLGCSRMMDNATVAMLGFRVPMADPAAAPAAAPAAPPPPPAIASRPAVPFPPVRPQPSGPSAAIGAQSGAGDAGGRAAGAVQTAASGGQTPRSGTTRPKAADAREAGKRLAAVAAGALAAGLVLGAVLFGGSSAPPEEPAEAPASASAPAPVPLDEAVPERGRCARCWALHEKGEVPLSGTWHWAEDCPRR